MDRDFKNNNSETTNRMLPIKPLDPKYNCCAGSIALTPVLKGIKRIPIGQQIEIRKNKLVSNL
jgi:hypothetical protein